MITTMILIALIIATSYSKNWKLGLSISIGMALGILSIILDAFFTCDVVGSC